MRDIETIDGGLRERHSSLRACGKPAHHRKLAEGIARRLHHRPKRSRSPLHDYRELSSAGSAGPPRRLMQVVEPGRVAQRVTLKTRVHEMNQSRAKLCPFLAKQIALKAQFVGSVFGLLPIRHRGGRVT
jgi:hypothetical protein